VIAPLLQGLANGPQAAGFEYLRHGVTASPTGRFNGIQDVGEFGLHVQQLAAGVLCLWTANRHQQAERARNGQGRHRARRGQHAVQLHARM
jgi:hypothetical protein